METQTISIRVSPEVARAYEAAPEEEKRKLNALLSLKLSETLQAKRPLEDILREIGRNARERGLTPEILRSILNDEEIPICVRYEHDLQCGAVRALNARTRLSPSVEAGTGIDVSCDVERVGRRTAARGL